MPLEELANDPELADYKSLILEVIRVNANPSLSEGAKKENLRNLFQAWAEHNPIVSSVVKGEDTFYGHFGKVLADYKNGVEPRKRDDVGYLNDCIGMPPLLMNGIEEGVDLCDVDNPASYHGYGFAGVGFVGGAYALLSWFANGGSLRTQMGRRDLLKEIGIAGAFGFLAGIGFNKLNREIDQDYLTNGEANARYLDAQYGRAFH